MKSKSVFLLLTALSILLGSMTLHAEAEGMPDLSTLYKNRDVDETWNIGDAQLIDLNTVQDSSEIRITEKGDYVLSGTLNGQIVIEAQEDAKVRLILNGVSITGLQGPAIYEKQADKLIVTLAEGTENTLTDGPVLTDADDTIGAALYTEDDLSINGSGSLTVNGTRKHGIQSKADLIIANGSIAVNAVLDGIRSRNSVLVLNGEISVIAGGDGIASTRTDADGKGWIILAGGTVTIRTGDGAGAARVSANSRDGGWGRRDDWGSASNTADSVVSQKAVKAATDLTVLDGTFSFNCADDGLHGVNVTVSGGIFTIQSGDDAMHADKAMTVNGGNIDITQCYEGLEGEDVSVCGGTIRIIASDDGINASGGSDGSGFGGRGRSGGFTVSGSSGMLTIAGGEIAVTAGGDGLDSNGSILISGGVTGVWAATTTGEGAIDFNGTGSLSGGTLIVASTGGVMRDTAGLSGQSIMAFSASGNGGETVTVLDEAGTVLGSFIPEQGFDTLMISSARLPEGSTCTVMSGTRALFSGSMTGSMAGAYGDDGFGKGRTRNRRGW